MIMSGPYNVDTVQENHNEDILPKPNYILPIPNYTKELLRQYNNLLQENKFLKDRLAKEKRNSRFRSSH